MTLQNDNLQSDLLDSLLDGAMAVCAFLHQNLAGLNHGYPGPVQDDAKYYDPPGGLLSLDLQLGSLVEQASHLDVDSTEDPIKVERFIPHFNLVNAQLSQVRQLSF